MPAIAKTRRSFAGLGTRLLEITGDGPPIVLLHGFTDSADTWRPVLERLAEAGRRAYAPDLPGSGRADPLPHGAMLAALDDFVADLIRELGEDEPVVLAGNSLGGVLALRAAADHDLPLAAIAPIAPAGFGFHARVEKLAELLDHLVPALRIAWRVPYPSWIVRDIAARFFAIRLGMGQADPELARRYASHIGGMRDLRRIGAMARQLTAEIQAGPFELDRIEVPVCAIWGRKDPVCDLRGAQDLLDAIPQARLVVLDESAHLPQVQQPAEVAHVLAGLPAVVPVGA